MSRNFQPRHGLIHTDANLGGPYLLQWPETLAKLQLVIYSQEILVAQPPKNDRKYLRISWHKSCNHGKEITFFTSGGRASFTPAWPNLILWRRDREIMEVKCIAVIGAGTMGRGITQVGALGGYDIITYDISLAILQQALTQIKESVTEGVKLGKHSEQQAQEAVQRISTTTTLKEAAERADFVIEAVPEDLALKENVFRELDQICRPGVIIATNTSTMSPTKLGSFTGRPDKVIGMHFFNPVPKMKLVEIVRGLETSDETHETAVQVAQRMSKETVTVKDSPGFITSRIATIVGNEAFHMLMEEVASAEDIDKAIRLGLNYPMGPLELGDMTGLDTRLKALQHLHSTLGERFRPSPLLQKYVDAGRLGRKTGKGVYKYKESD